MWHQRLDEKDNKALYKVSKKKCIEKISNKERHKASK